MIVSCPNCGTKYNLPDDKVPIGGVKVKCSKCSHLFKVVLPPATPEEEVEVLLDDPASPKPADDQGSDFDAAFEEAVAGEGADEDDIEDDLDDMDFGIEDDAEDEADITDEAKDDAEDDDAEDDFGIDDDDDDDVNLNDDNDDDLDTGGFFASLDGDKNLDMDARPKRKGGFGKLLLTLLLFIILILVLAVLTFNLRLWSVPQSLQDVEIELPFELPLEVPFVKTVGTLEPSVEEPVKAEPVGDPLDRIKQIQPVDFRQYVINNELEGRIFVVEGQALNNSDSPKERIMVEVALFDAGGLEMGVQEMLCGNTLSLFQLQVDNRLTIEKNLTSSRGTNLNNSYIKPGETTPFMFVFFDLENKVEEYRIQITDAHDPQR